MLAYSKYYKCLKTFCRIKELVVFFKANNYVLNSNKYHHYTMNIIKLYVLFSRLKKVFLRPLLPTRGKFGPLELKIPAYYVGL